MIRKIFFWPLLVILLVSGLAGCTKPVVDHQQVANNEKIVIKFSHVTAENSPKGLAAERFANLVRKRTGGYVEVQVFPNSTLYTDGEEIDALQKGNVQMIAPATSKLSAMFPEWQLLDLPFAFPDLQSVHTFMDGPIGRQMLAQLQTKNMLGLAMWNSGFKEMTNNKRPLIKPSDFQMLRFRIMPSQVLQDQFELLGASTDSMPFNDVGNALTTGQVDGEENTISNIYTQEFDQSQKYLTLSDHGYLGYVVLTNADFWHSLPPSIRKILEDTLAEVTQWERLEAEEVNKRQLADLEKQGDLQIHRLTPSEKQAWQQALAPVYNRLAERIGAGPVNSVKEITSSP